MDEYIDPKPGRSSGGCFIVIIAVLMILGLAMWFYLWGRSAPKVEGEPIPTTAPQQKPV